MQRPCEKSSVHHRRSHILIRNKAVEMGRYLDRAVFVRMP